MELVPVIICGGVGSRLWPVSRVAHPKPFIELPDGENLMRKTLRRAANLPGVSRIAVVTNRDLLFKTDDEFQSLGLSCELDYILEPVGRNTAADKATFFL